MTPDFDKYCDSILNEEFKLPRCKGESFPQLSIKPEYRWMRCVSNPYSTGYRRVFFGKRGRSTDVSKCLSKPAAPGTQKREECDMVLRMLRKLHRRKNKSRRRR